MKKNGCARQQDRYNMNNMDENLNKIQNLLMVLNLQKFSLHDGPGIRTTVFFKGCHLCCAWCHNPESQCFARTLLYDRRLCAGCGACVSVCPESCIGIRDQKSYTHRQHCTLCGLCADICQTGARQMCGQWMTVDEIVRIAIQDRTFYDESGGGVTLSGGDPLHQNIAAMTELCRRLRDERLHITLDTSGYVSTQALRQIAPLIDLFLFDLKIMDPVSHKAVTGVDVDEILASLRYLDKIKAHVIIRVPLIEPVNCSDEQIQSMAIWLSRETSFRQIELMPYHNWGAYKYEQLEQPYAGTSYKAPDKTRISHIIDLFQQHDLFARESSYQAGL